MGWGKKLKKAVKKATKQVVKTVEKGAKDAVGVAAGVAGLGGKDTVVQEAPQQAAPVQAPVAAQIVEPPSKEDVDTDDDAQTESGRKKARAGGKKSLSVARSSGGGINI